MLSALNLNRLAARPALSDNRYTSGDDALFLSYYEQLPLRQRRFHQAETDLSHDGLNPAHVPF